MDEEKVIQGQRRPNNLKTLRGFLGMINNFKSLISDLGRRGLPLMELLRKGVPFKWAEERENAFQGIIELFLQNLKVYYPDYNILFILRTDASIHRFSRVLLQKK